MNLKDYLDGLRGKRVAVLGMGISNEPLVKLLAAEGLEVTVRDKRELPPMDGVKTITGPDYLRDLTEDVVFRTPGIRPDQIPLKPGAVLTSEMEVLAAPGTQGSWQLGQQEIQCSRRLWQPVLANTLQYSCLESPAP